MTVRICCDAEEKIFQQNACAYDKWSVSYFLPVTSPNVDRFSNFFTDRFTSKYATKSSLTIPPHIKGFAELPCETSVSENSENLMHASLSTTNHNVVCSYTFEVWWVIQ